MVHALQEARRVLIPAGTLIDLRPLSERAPLEVAWRGGYREAGRATDLPGPLEDDAAANAAMQAASESGMLVPEQRQSFPLFYYWDTPREMQEYVADEWDDVLRVEDDVWSALRSLWATSEPDARVRIRMKMLITRYQIAS